MKLEATYFLNVRCHYLHIYSLLGTLKRSEIKLSIIHQRYHPKLTEHILNNKHRSKCFYIHKIIRLP